MYTWFADMCLILLNVHAGFHTVEGEGGYPPP